MKEKTIFVENYHSANINGFCKVILTDTVQGQIRINAGENIIDKISVQSNNKELDVSLIGLEDYDLKDVIICIPSVNLSTISVTGAGELATNSILNLDTLSCNFAGASMVNLELNVQKLNLNIDGAGEFNLKGSVTNLFLKCNGAYSFNAATFIAKNIELNTEGASKISLHCKENISGEIKGVAAVTIYGRPSSKMLKNSGVGIINYQ